MGEKPFQLILHSWKINGWNLRRFHPLEYPENHHLPKHQISRFYINPGSPRPNKEWFLGWYNVKDSQSYHRAKFGRLGLPGMFIFRGVYTASEFPLQFPKSPGWRPSFKFRPTTETERSWLVDMKPLDERSVMGWTGWLIHVITTDRDMDLLFNTSWNMFF